MTGRKREAELFTGADSPTVEGWAVEGATELDALGRVTKEWYRHAADHRCARGLLGRDTDGARDPRVDRRGTPWTG